MFADYESGNDGFGKFKIGSITKPLTKVTSGIVKAVSSAAAKPLTAVNKVVTRATSPITRATMRIAPKGAQRYIAKAQPGAMMTSITRGVTAIPNQTVAAGNTLLNNTNAVLQPRSTQRNANGGTPDSTGRGMGRSARSGYWDESGVYHAYNEPQTAQLQEVLPAVQDVQTNQNVQAMQQYTQQASSAPVQSGGGGNYYNEPMQEDYGYREDGYNTEASAYDEGYVPEEEQTSDVNVNEEGYNSNDFYYEDEGTADYDYAAMDGFGGFMEDAKALYNTNIKEPVGAYLTNKAGELIDRNGNKVQVQPEPVSTPVIIAGVAIASGIAYMLFKKAGRKK